MGKKWKKNLERTKNINVTTIMLGVDKFMRNHPLYGESYTREKNIEELFKPKKRVIKRKG